MRHLPQGHVFSQVPKAEIPRSTFDRSHGYKTTFDAGYLIPVYHDEVLPADTFHLSATLFGRLNTPIYPFMDNMYLDSFFFFVPNRLLWTNWQRFMGEQDNPDDSIDYLVPSMTSPVGGYLNSTLQDYFGLPTQVGGVEHISLPLRAYNLVYNTWFRDQNLQDSVPVDLDDGPDAPADYVLLRRGKRHDYFTSALPWPQKGDAVQLPLGSSAAVWGSTTVLPTTATQNTAPIMGAYVDRVTDGVYQGAPNFNNTVVAAAFPVGGVPVTIRGAGTGSGNIAVQDTQFSFYNETLSKAVNPNAVPPFYADLSSATASTVNSLRMAFQLQKLLERDARGGTRYIEIIKAHFNVTSPDARLQRPEYLGGGSSPININPVAQTSATADSDTPLAELAAVGTVSASGHGFSKSFVEHGVILGLVSVRADMTYQQGLARTWSRKTKYDYYWPALSHIGEQAVLNKEIYAQGTANPTADAAVFGYQERHAEYRYKPSQITGQFRSNFAQSLDGWHLAQEFASLPSLNDAFIVENPPVDRVIAVPSEPHFKLDCFFKIRSARPMPVYGVPSLVDHF